jgi:putative ABC transport system permease protein
MRILQSILKDVRFSTRTLRKRPGFTAIVIITLALGIGANTTIFSVVNAVLLQPLPFPRSEELVTLWERNPVRGYEQNAPAAGNYVDWLQQNRVFSQMAIYAPAGRFNLAAGDQAERINGAAVSSSLFKVLEVAPAQGRSFTAEEDVNGPSRVVIVSYNFSKLHFGDRNAVGNTITLDGRDVTIIGVMPPGFQFPGATGTVLKTFTAPAADLWIPLVLDQETLNQRSSHSLSVIARLKPGISVSQATQEMSAIQQRLEQQYPTFFVGSHVKVVPLVEQVVGSTRRPIYVLWGAVGFVLLICCVNVANLMLSFATSRRREIAVRTALGAQRWRVIRQLLTESLVLATAGGAIGVLVAVWGVRLLALLAPATFPRREEIALNVIVLLFTILITALTGVFFGLAPAVQASKVTLTEALNAGRSTIAIGWGTSFRRLLVISEIAFALILMIGASLMIQSLFRLERVNPGFSADRTLTMELSLPSHNYPRARRPNFFRELLDRTRSLPGVESVAAAKHLPLSGDNMNFALNVEGRPALEGREGGADCRFVTPDYFKVLGIQLVKGRVFTDGDGPDAPPVLLINETVALNHFPNEDPIGKRLVLGINNFSGVVVGVVRDVKHVGLDLTGNSEVYVNYAQGPYWTDMTLLVHTSGDPLAVAASVRNQIAAIDAQVPVARIRTMDSIVSDSVAQPKFRSVLLVVFGMTALLLATVGIYGVMSYAVTQRTKEIGIRIALGAQLKSVRGLVIMNGLTLAIIGIGVGLVGAFVLTRFLTSLLFETNSNDPLTFVGVAGGLAIVALIACYIPARRATKVNPLVALRYE